MLRCNTPVQKVGMLKEGSMPVFYYEIHNDSDKIYKIKPWSNCGCSSPIIPKEFIEPKSTMSIQVEFDTMGKVGINEKSFGFFYGENNKEKLSLKFIAEVVK